MKKMTTIGMMVLMLSMSLPAMSAMSISKVRENARFLTDKMTYELGLNRMQYDDIYEVNYDFINNIRYIMDDVVRGYGYAVDRYYEYLDYRNDDLRWILSDRQYRRFMQIDYFYRPVYTTQSNWLFRIFKVYTDVKFFHYAKPKHYKSYKGGHFRTHHNHVSFYKTHRKEQYKHPVYKGETKVQRRPVVKPTDKRKETVKKSGNKVQRKESIGNKNTKQKVQRKEEVKKAESRPEQKVQRSVKRKQSSTKIENRTRSNRTTSSVREAGRTSTQRTATRNVRAVN